MELNDRVTLEVLGLALPVFQSLFPYDVYLDITDTEQFIFVAQAQSFKLKVKTGDPIPPGSMAEKMLATKQPGFTRASKESTIFGFPYIAQGIPLTHNDSVIGTMSLAMNVDDLEQMENLSQLLLAFLEQSRTKVQELSASAGEMSATAKVMTEQSEKTQQESAAMVKTLTEVQKIAQQSHVLSINTSIEASRLGQAGRSFLVISQHMQNLAATSLESSRSINEGLTQFQTNLQATLGSLNTISQVAQQQATDLNSLAAAGQEVTHLAEEFGKISLFRFAKK